MKRRPSLSVLTFICMLFCTDYIHCSFGAQANPYSEQSATGPNASTPSRYDLQEAARWAARMDAADDQSLAPIITEMGRTLQGMSDGHDHPPTWFGVSSIHGCLELVPGLTRALKSRDPRIVSDAAYCLALVGAPSALSAVPTMVALYPVQKRPMTSSDVRWEDALSEVTASLWTLYGGSVATGDAVELLLFSKNPVVRLGTINFLTQGPLPMYGMIYPAGIDQWNTARYMNPPERFYASQVPALAHAAEQDPNPEIRMATLQALAGVAYPARMEYDHRLNPWEVALPGLANMMTDSARSLAERRAATYLVVRVPADPTPIIPQALQAILDPDPTIRSYSLLLLEHCELIGPERLQSEMLKGLSSRDVVKRRRTAEQLRLSASALWGYSPALGQIGPKQDELTLGVSTEQISDSRLFWWPSHGFDQPNDEPRRTRLVEALSHAVSDPDHAVRVSAALAIKRVGEDINWSFDVGSLWLSTQCEVPPIKTVLETVASGMSHTDPMVAEQLRQVIKELMGRHSAE